MVDIAVNVSTRVTHEVWELDPSFEVWVDVGLECVDKDDTLPMRISNLLLIHPAGKEQCEGNDHHGDGRL